MKKVNTFFIIILLFIAYGCSSNHSEYEIVENINTNCYITKVSTFKYSKVQGYIYYKGIKLEINNGNSGYYYKKYNLKSGDVIITNITIYKRLYYAMDPYKNDLILSTSDIDVTNYEIN